MTISAGYPSITIIVTMTIENLIMRLFGHHQGKQWASGNQKIPSHQHLEKELGQLNYVLRWRYAFILLIEMSISSQWRGMNVCLCLRRPRRYVITCLHDWIRPLMSIFPRGRFQMEAVSNWSHRKLEIYGDMSHWLNLWQASLLVQNSMPRQLVHEFRRYSWHFRIS